MTQDTLRAAEIEIVGAGTDTVTFRLRGQLTSKTAGQIWRQADEALKGGLPSFLSIDAAGLDYCDGSGVGLFIHLRQSQMASGKAFEIRGLTPESKNLLDLAGGEDAAPVSVKREKTSFIVSLGKSTVGVLEDFQTQIAFIGEILVNLLYAARNPRLVRWRDTRATIVSAGIQAVPIILMIGFFVGMIMAFQSALPLQQMGSDVFVADIVAFSVLRELGPLITAIVLAGRTGSAFAAEIGTMKVNEEINALQTMGLSPVRFLVTSRVLAVFFLTPLLTIFTDFFGMLGGAVVFKSLGYSIVTYVNQITASADIGDVIGGIVKAFAFGVIVAAVGCMRGLQTKTGASAVGQSTTSSVVTGIVLIIITDAFFSILYYALGV